MSTQELAALDLDRRRYRCLTKAVRRRLDHKADSTTPSIQVTRGFHWVAARRGWLNVYDKRIVVGDWVIRRAEVQAVSAQVVRSLGMKITVLIVQTHDYQYQFGTNPWVKPLAPIEMAFGEEIVPVDAKLGWSFFSIAARLGCLGYWTWFLLSQIRGQ